MNSPPCSAPWPKANSIKRVVGIDPGLTGGLVALTPSGTPINYRQIPRRPDGFIHLEMLRIYLKDYHEQESYFWLEKVWSRPGEGAASSHKFGRVFGVLEGILVGLQADYSLVPPTTWCKELHKGIVCTNLTQPMKAKDKSRIALQTLFPNADFPRGPRNGKVKDGIMDAALIAEYGRRVIFGQEVKDGTLKVGH